MDGWELNARMAVMSLIARYAAEIDAGSLADVAALFDVVGVLVVSAGRQYRGPAAISEFLEASRASRATPDGVVTIRHHMAPPDIGFENADRAAATSAFVAMGAVGPDHWGVYRDRFIRTDAGWRFAAREVTIEGIEPSGWIGTRRDPSADTAG